MNTVRQRHYVLVMTALVVTLLAALMMSLLVGRYSAPPSDVLRVLFDRASMQAESYNAVVVVLDVRLPRICAALLVGATLALSGATFQAVFGNPLVSPDLLGTSAGAGLGASIAIIAQLGPVAVQLQALVGGLAGTSITYSLSTVLNRTGTGVLGFVLIGIVVSAVLEAGISITKYVADPYTDLKTLTNLLMGSLGAARFSEIGIALPFAVLGTVLVLKNRYQLNLLGFNEEEAQAMGINTTVLRLQMILGATLLCSAAVSIAGIVGWVGLVVPHIGRILVGPDTHKMLPVTLLCGLIFMLVIDAIARSYAALEIPIGVLTGVIGAPLFITLLLKGRTGWN